MLAHTTERQDLFVIINTLTDTSIEKLSHYIEYLRYEERMEELEETEDIAYIEAHKSDSIEPFDRKEVYK